MSHPYANDSRPLLVWDVDDVLNELLRFWLSVENAGTGRNIPFSALTENPPDRIMGLSRKEYLASLDAYRAGGHYRQPPREEIMIFFRTCGARFRHLVLSAVPIRFAGPSADWVLTYFGPWIQNCLFVPSPRPDFPMESQLFSSKAEAMSRIGRDAILIDDSPLHVIETVKAGASAFLFPAPWNENNTLPVWTFLERIAQLNPGE